MKFLDGVDALGYKYNGTPAYLMSAEQYALFLSHIYDTDASNFIETSTVELLPNEAGVLSYTIPVGIAGSLLSTKIDGNGFCAVDLSINSEVINSGRNSYARPAISFTEKIEVNSGDVLDAKVTNTSIFGQTNTYKIYLYLMLRQI